MQLIHYFSTQLSSKTVKCLGKSRHAADLNLVKTAGMLANNSANSSS
jgi:hypothetical protein